jgi:hypothetical protein
MIDTLFSLAEAHLFMQLVELQDSRPHLLPPGKAYSDLYRCAPITSAKNPFACDQAGTAILCNVAQHGDSIYWY